MSWPMFSYIYITSLQNLTLFLFSISLSSYIELGLYQENKMSIFNNTLFMFCPIPLCNITNRSITNSMVSTSILQDSQNLTSLTLVISDSKLFFVFFLSWPVMFGHKTLHYFYSSSPYYIELGLHQRNKKISTVFTVCYDVAGIYRAL